MRKPWSNSRNLTKKRTKLHHFSKRRDQIDTKKMEDQLDIFEGKEEPRE